MIISVYIGDSCTSMSQYALSTHELIFSKMLRLVWLVGLIGSVEAWLRGSDGRANVTLRGSSCCRWSPSPALAALNCASQRRVARTGRGHLQSNRELPTQYCFTPGICAASYRRDSYRMTRRPSTWGSLSLKSKMAEEDVETALQLLNFFRGKRGKAKLWLDARLILVLMSWRRPVERYRSPLA